MSPQASPGTGAGMRYQRLLPLGSGGMAKVHLALAVGQSGFKRLVVVKSVREELVTDTAMRQMFLAEARLSARLNHPNVVQVSEVVEAADGGVMLVMEYLDGLPLSAAYRALADTLTVPMRLRVLCEVLAGLQYAHDLTDYHGHPLGIVHRDVSPQNVFITYDGRVKLLDFGIAKVNASPDRTRTGVIKGHIAYMPIEQVTAQGVDRRTDVYAVGCLLWEAIANQRMWGPLSEPQLAREVVRGNVPRLSERVEVDADLERIVARATSRAASDRHQSAEALRIDLEHYLTRTAPVSLREVGELLSRACSLQREDRQRALAEAVATAERDISAFVDSESERFRSAGGALTEVSGVSSRPRSLRLSPMPGSSQITLGGEVSRTAVAPVVPKRPGRLVLFIGLAAALLVAAVAIWRTQSLPALTSPSAVATVSPAPAAPTPSGVGEVVDPAATTDSSTPSAVASPRRARGRAPNVAAASAKGAAVKARPAAGCDPPYYFSAGIKTYKPECI